MVYDKFVVGQAVRKLRIDKHMTIGSLAEAVNRSSVHMNMIELGTRKMSFDLLFALMTVFHTDANTVLGVPFNKEHTEEVSVDERLEQLEKKQREYYKVEFLHMLDNIPDGH
jgi:transcriptional regulator with XRE-family HTH domain